MKKILLILVVLVALTGCGLKNEAKDCSDGFHVTDGICIEDANNVGSFTTSNEVLTLFTSFKEKREITNSFYSRSMVFGDTELDSAETNDSYKNDSGSDDYSETNNQVEGVDEMDNVLTDGKYIYIQNYNKIQIVLAYTQSLESDALKVVKEITYETLEGDHEYFYFNGMYVDDERLLIIGNSYYYTCNGEEVESEYYSDEGDYKESYTNCNFYEYHTVTRVMEYSKEDFKLINEYEISGNFVGSRKIGDNVYVVTNEYIPFYMNDYEEYNFDLDNYLPYYSINGTEVYLGYEDILYVEGTEPTTYTSFYGINLDTQEVSSEVVLGGGGYNLYVSIEHIYLTATKWSWDASIYGLIEEAVDDGDTINDVLIEESPYEISTSIVKVGIDAGKVQFDTTGEVAGMTLNQFSMDEHNGYVRIVTTTNNWWWWEQETEIQNRLFILDEELNIVSTLEDLGKQGETVQSTRFVGDYAYIVTFLNTDPFYVIDLSDPEKPVKLSELEVPGFSSYLQPIGEDYILGIGFGDLEGGTQGLKISLYDVSDKSETVIASEIVYPYENQSYIWTSTIYNHKDLLVSIEKGIITLPYTEYDWSNNNWQYNSGALVLNLDIENGSLSERGRVLHSEADHYDIYLYKAKFISNYLYTISSKFIKVSTIEKPEIVLNSVQVGESREIYYPSSVEPELED
jgi:uncharacterized secreted protein with C-terminal beta-propeller domain